MRYLLAIFIPPLAVLLCGKVGLAILNFLLWCFFLIPGIIHAFLVISSHKAEKRSKAVLQGIQNQTNQMRQAMNTHSEIAARQAQAQIELSKAQIASQMATTGQLAQMSASQQQQQLASRNQVPAIESREKYQVSRDSQVIGEWSKSDIRKYLQAGNLTATDWVWSKERNSWESLQHFLQN